MHGMGSARSRLIIQSHDRLESTLPVTESPSEPVVELALEGARITLLGTAHVSRASADKVRELLTSGDYDAVAVELCPSRHNAIVDPDALARMDLFDVLRSGRAPMVASSLALGAYQQRLAEQFGIRPGEEMRVAVEMAREAHLPVLLVDREIGVTFKRVYRSLRFLRRAELVAGLLAGVVSRQEISEAEIERLKEGDILESAFSQFAEQHRDLYEPLIAERDRYMAARLKQEVGAGGYRRVLAVVGAGHLQGIARTLTEASTPEPAATLQALDHIPPGSRVWRLVPWLIVALIVMGFALGFSRSSALGWEMVAEWGLITGGLAAVGTVVALGHPLTVITSFLSAPLTSLNPTIGVGMIAAAVEVWLRRPQVGDFGRLRLDTTQLRGWWRNRVTRVLLVFLFSSLGGAIGTYVAGYRIFERLI